MKFISILFKKHHQSPQSLPFRYYHFYDNKYSIMSVNLQFVYLQNARTYQFEGHTSLCQNHVQESHGGYEGIKEQVKGLETGILYDEI